MTTTGNLDRIGSESEESYLLREMIEKKKLEKWQKYVCELTHVFGCCVDANGALLTPFSGNPDESARILKAIDKEQLQNMLFRVSESTLEDQAIEETAYPNLRLAVITAKADRKPVFSWLICGVLSDVSETEEYPNPPLQGFSSTITEKNFFRTIDGIRYITAELLGYKIAAVTAEAESRRSRYSEKEMKMTLKRTEALTGVIQLLESDA